MPLVTCNNRHRFVEMVFIFRPILDEYQDGCRNVLSSKVELTGLCLAPARHALINIDAAEAV